MYFFKIKYLGKNIETFLHLDCLISHLCYSHEARLQTNH